jgi:hypothetical protein
MKIYRTTDKIPVKIDSIEFKISPLNYHQKAAVQAEILKAEQGNPMAIMAAARLAIKYSLKEVSGITDSKDQPYELEFDSEGLTDQCVDDLLNADADQRLQLVCMTLLQGQPKHPVDAQGQPIKGIKIGGNPKGKK